MTKPSRVPPLSTEDASDDRDAKVCDFEPGHDRDHESQPAPITSRETRAPERCVGRYAMFGEIASGAMASVHFGRLVGPVGFARTVAIKRLHAPYARDPEFVTMFLDEARLVARIRHPNVVQTLDIVPMDGELFLVLEYVQGESLSRLIRATTLLGTKVPVRISATVMASVLHGLHAAHETRDPEGRLLGIVHRDVSPHNVMVGADGTARVLDFGVAYAKDRAQPTRNGHIEGKLAYMAPEQLLGDVVDRQTDVYAAAVVLWELLTGERLFDADDQAQIIERATSGRIDRPSKYTPQLATSIEDIVMRGLALRREDRWATAKDMAVALERAAGVATPSMVSGWVESVAGDTLDARQRELSLIERSPLSDEETQPSSITSRLILNTPATIRPIHEELATFPSNTSLRVTGEIDVSPGPLSIPEGFSRERYAYIAVGLLASCGFGVLLGVLVHASPVSRTASGAPPPPSVQTTAPAERLSVSPPGTNPMASFDEGPVHVGPPPAASVSASASARDLRAVGDAETTSSPTANPDAGEVSPSSTKAPLPKASAKPAVECSTPSTLDDAGQRRYRVECE